jgi:glycosyltransferase involved in cell wall biosynthesis
MVERKQLTLIYSYDDNWIGGTYYILNIVRALNTLSEDLKPKLLILHDPGANLNPVLEIHYPFLTFHACDLKMSLVDKVINKVFFYLNGSQVRKVKLPDSVATNVYPLAYYMDDSNLDHAFYWIPDLQEYYLPDFFPKLEVRRRKMIHKDFVKRKNPIVFSSQTAANDFDKFYPNNSNEKHIINFASFIGTDYLNIDIKVLRDKFKISKPFFMIPNQFWRHKNHKVVFEAIIHLKNIADSFQVVFTGKQSDYRNPGYFESLSKLVEDNNLQDSVRFLGFIDRNEQLQLMANSISIIQPSLFEGWSTVVEDAKVINQFILVSDIPLHREQAKINCKFFNPHDHKDLANKMREVLNHKDVITPHDYAEVQEKFGRDVTELF